MGTKLSRGAANVWLATLVALVSVICVLYVSHREGRGDFAQPGAIEMDSPGRPGAPVVLVASTAPELLRTWREYAGGGRRLVNLSAYLHFVSRDIGSEPLPGGYAFPVRLDELKQYYTSQPDHMNYLWMAMESGVARRVDHIMPQDSYARKIRSIEAGEAGHLLSGTRRLHTGAGLSILRDGRIYTSYLGSARVISPDAGHLGADEPLVINIDASFMRAGIREFDEVMKAIGPRADLITIYLGQDSPDVTDSQRRSLLALRPEIGRWVSKPSRCR